MAAKKLEYMHLNPMQCNLIGCYATALRSIGFLRQNFMNKTWMSLGCLHIFGRYSNASSVRWDTDHGSKRFST